MVASRSPSLAAHVQSGLLQRGRLAHQFSSLAMRADLPKQLRYVRHERDLETPAPGPCDQVLHEGEPQRAGCTSLGWAQAGRETTTAAGQTKRGADLCDRPSRCAGRGGLHARLCRRIPRPEQ